MYCNKENVNILTDLLHRHGIRHVVVCPGSRNAPLVHNFNEHPDLICHAVTDERSAGFITLGLTIATGQPAAVCVTSGSALLNVLPAAAEATYQRQGILVISADRPAAWVDQLDGQTMPQPGAMGPFAPKCVSLPEPQTDDERWHCNRLANEALLALNEESRPSVHINVPITEPLFDFSVGQLPKQRAVRRITFDEACQMMNRSERPMVVAGQMPYEKDLFRTLERCAVVLTEPLSTDEPTLTDVVINRLPTDMPECLPDLVLYIGGHTISKTLRRFLRSLPETTTVVMVNPDGILQDVTQHATCLLKAQPRDVIGRLKMSDPQPTPYMAFWAKHIEEMKARIAAVQPCYSQALAVKKLEERVAADDMVFYANSSAVRLGAIYARHYCHCNRGLNGIEGSLSTAAGAALACPDRRVWCVIGDLSFFYDSNAFWPDTLGGNLRILLLNNQTGGIFHQLPGLDKSPARDPFVAARHSLTAEHLCQHFGVLYLRATDEDTLSEGLRQLCDTENNRPVLLEVMTDAATDAKACRLGQ